MYLVRVAPITRGVGKTSLSYIAREQIAPGSLVQVPVRGRETPALVLGCTPAADAKASIKSADFTLKQLGDRCGARLFTAAFMDAATRIAETHATTLGAVIHALTPTAVLRNPQTFAGEAAETASATAPSVLAPRTILQNDTAARAEVFRNATREAFARGASVFICTPTTRDAERLGSYLEKGISPYVTLLHGSLTARQRRDRWQTAIADPHPRVIVATPTFLSLPRQDCDTYCIEREQSPFYAMQTRPHLDLRVATEHVSAAAGARCVFADFPVRTETYYRFEHHELEEFGVPARRSAAARRVTITNPATHSDADSEQTAFRVFSTEFEDRLQTVHARGGRTFIYAPRRGLATTVLCNDCGCIVRCRACNATVTLHRGRGRQHNQLVCHACGDRRDAHECCQDCGSWRLQELGIGSEKLADTTRTLLGTNEHVFELNADTARTHGQASRLATSFAETPGATLIGTDRALPYLPDHIALASVASADAVLAIPDFRGAERLIATSLHLAEYADECFVHTRAPDTPLYAHLTSGRLADFYRDELAVRQALSLPPYTTLIAVRYPSARHERVGEAVSRLRAFLTEHAYRHEQYTAGPRSGRSHAVVVTVIRVPRHAWPARTLQQQLQGLPHNCSVDVFAESLF